MGKKDLKKQYPALDVSVIDYVSRIDPSKTNKLTPFLLKIISKQTLDKKHLVRTEWSNIVNNRIDMYIVEMLMDIIGEGRQGLQTLKEFNEHLENNRIENTDISQYETWEDILAQKGIADMKMMDKELSKQVERIYEDSTWLIIKPLSFSSSLIYGSGTKWCTAMKREPHYFYKYSSEGILIYVINKSNGKKFGICSNPHEVSFWNMIDNRIDSLESGIPFEILSIIREKIDLKSNPKNHELFSDEEKENKRKHYIDEFKDYESELMPMSEELDTDVMYIEDEILIPDENLEVEAIQVGNYFRIINNDDIQ